MGPGQPPVAADAADDADAAAAATTRPSLLTLPTLLLPPTPTMMLLLLRPPRCCCCCCCRCDTGLLFKHASVPQVVSSVKAEYPPVGNYLFNAYYRVLIVFNAILPLY